MLGQEPFDFITSKETEAPVFDEFHELTSAHVANIDVQVLSKLRKLHPDLTVTAIPATNCNLTRFALAGNAAIELDLETDNVFRYRGFVPALKRNQDGSLAEAISFAKFRYVWNGNALILYTVGSTQFVLAEPREGETSMTNSATTDALIKAIGQWISSDHDVVYVFDGRWLKSKDLWNEVQKASWDDVILDPALKQELFEVTTKFFDSKDVYEQFGVPWKVGVLCLRHLVPRADVTLLREA